jgi:ketosteroid isomerase-like protein
MGATLEGMAKRYQEGVNGRGGQDFRDLFAPKVVWWHSDDETEPPILEGSLIADRRSADSDAFLRLMPDLHKDERLFVGDHGFTLEQVVSGTLADGSRLFVPHCEVATVEDGRITRVSIYIDRQHHQPMIKAMQSLRGSTS